MGLSFTPETPGRRHWNSLYWSFQRAPSSTFFLAGSRGTSRPAGLTLADLGQPARTQRLDNPRPQLRSRFPSKPTSLSRAQRWVAACGSSAPGGALFAAVLSCCPRASHSTPIASARQVSSHKPNHEGKASETRLAFTIGAVANLRIHQGLPAAGLHRGTHVASDPGARYIKTGSARQARPLPRKRAGAACF